MKNILSCIFVLLCVCESINSQTPFSIQAHEQQTVNVLVAGNLMYNIRGQVNSVSGGGSAIYFMARDTNYGIPIMTNISFYSDSTTSQEVFAIGILPYMTIYKDKKIEWNLHGGFSYAIPNLKRTHEKEFHAMAGIELAVKKKGLPITISVAQQYERSIQNANDDMWSMGLDIVIPIESGLCLLIKNKLPFETEVKSEFGIGIVLIGALNKRS